MLSRFVSLVRYLQIYDRLPKKHPKTPKNSMNCPTNATCDYHHVLFYYKEYSFLTLDTGFFTWYCILRENSRNARENTDNARETLVLFSNAIIIVLGGRRY